MPRENDSQRPTDEKRRVEHGHTLAGRRTKMDCEGKSVLAFRVRTVFFPNKEWLNRKSQRPSIFTPPQALHPPRCPSPGFGDLLPPTSRSCPLPADSLFRGVSPSLPLCFAPQHPASSEKKAQPPSRASRPVSWNANLDALKRKPK